MNDQITDTVLKRRQFRRKMRRVVPIVAVLVALLVALYLVSGVQKGHGELSNQYVWVLVVTILALLILLWGIGHRLVVLFRRVKSEEPGARLSARWVRNFIGLSIPPALIVYFFSMWFLNSTVDKWFDVEIETALADSLQLGQEFLDIRTLEVRNQLREITRDVETLPEGTETLRQALLDHIHASGPVELSVLNEDGTLVATANIDALPGLTDRPADFALLQSLERGEYAAAEPAPAGGLQIRVIQQIPKQLPGDSTRVLQAMYPLPENITALTGSIEQEYHRYQNVSYLRSSLKQSFGLILTLVLMLTILLAMLAALNAARRMVVPLSKLSGATRQVAGGDFDRRVDSHSNDEIGFLVNSFNEMTNALKNASEMAEQSRRALQEQGDYLETVLGNLSAGVLTLDPEHRMITANAACKLILGLPEESSTGTSRDFIAGQPLESLSSIAPFLDPFVMTIKQQAARKKKEWQQEIRLDRTGTPLVLLMRGTRLPLPGEESGGEESDGMVIVFDDVTILNQAQRAAAWAEVARRLAHEVKNPLTPIRLAAERLRMKLTDKLESADSEMLNKASSTIVAQVEALRTLVDAFGDYAQEPILSRESIRLDQLVREVVVLYQQGDTDLAFELDLCPGPEGLAADSGRLRQMLHNLIRNAKEAGAAGDKAGQQDQSREPVALTIRSRMIQLESQAWLSLELSDNGPGFPEAVLGQPFEPYVTSKPSGSGLGLAICRKIVTEHEGRISLSNIETGGAMVTILLPLNIPVTVPEPEKLAG
jgi:nitrogen fixation/metabolism regulation signal transduction histidine kinase